MRLSIRRHDTRTKFDGLLSFAGRRRCINDTHFLLVIDNVRFIFLHCNIHCLGSFNLSHTKTTTKETVSIYNFLKHLNHVIYVDKWFVVIDGRHR